MYIKKQVCFLLCVCVQVFAQKDTYGPKVAQANDECAAKAKVSDGQFIAIMEGKEAPTTPETKCLAKCFMVKTGLMDSSDNYSLEPMRIWLKKSDYDKNTIDEIMNKCSGIKRNNACETASEAFKCILQRIP